MPSRASTAPLLPAAISMDGCTTPPTTASYDGLKRIRTRNLDQAWLRRGAELARCDRIMFRSGTVRYLHIAEGRTARVSALTRFPPSAFRPGQDPLRSDHGTGMPRRTRRPRALRAQDGSDAGRPVPGDRTHRCPRSEPQGSEFARTASTAAGRMRERLARRWASGPDNRIDEKRTFGGER